MAVLPASGQHKRLNGLGSVTQGNTLANHVACTDQILWADSKKGVGQPQALAEHVCRACQGETSKAKAMQRLCPCDVTFTITHPVPMVSFQGMGSFPHSLPIAPARLTPTVFESRRKRSLYGGGGSKGRKWSGGWEPLARKSSSRDSPLTNIAPRENNLRISK